MNFSTFVVDSASQLESKLEKLSIDSNCNYLIQCFSTQSKNIIGDLLQAVDLRIPFATVIGASCTHFIHQNRTIQNGTLIIITQFYQTELTTALVLRADNLEEEGKTLYKRLSVTPETKAVISFADGVDATSSVLYSSFTGASAKLNLAGGVSTPGLNGNWVLLNGDFFEKACVAVALKGFELQVWSHYFHEWNPIGKVFTVTEANGERLIALDNEAPLDIYQHYLSEGQPITFQEIKEFPLIHLDNQSQSIFIPSAVAADGSIDFNGTLRVGDKLRFCYDHPSLTIQKVKGTVAQLKKSSPEAICFYNCLSRLDFMDGDAELEIFDDLMQASGAYCMGEICRTEQSAKILHHSFSVLAMREGQPPLNPLQIRPKSVQNQDELRGVAPLFSLIKNSLADIDQMQSHMEQTIREQSASLIESYQIDHRTELPNRSALKEALTDIGVDEHLLSIKMVNFAQVNEKYGYQVGDQLLVDLTRHFQKLLESHSPGDFALYSLGVAEWGLVLETEASSKQINSNFAQMAELTENVNFEPLGLPDLDYLSVSICGGIVSRRDFLGDSPDELLLKSIEARRRAYKLQEYLSNAITLKSEVNQRQEEFSWLTCVSRAILNDKVIAYAQPIVEAKTHKLVSHECLVRIEEDGNVLAPGMFFPIIEGTHLYARLSRQMITRSFEAMKESSHGFSINLSPQDFMSDKTILHLEEALRSAPNPNRVGLEVLETEQIRDYGRMIEVCEHFRNLGARIIVDDFGSGYSNIDEIIKLEPHIIKLDGSLIRNIDRDEKQRAIAQQLVNLCKVFNAKTVAEFVHNKEVCELAEEMGINYLQGYYFSAPQPIAKV